MALRFFKKIFPKNKITTEIVLNNDVSKKISTIEKTEKKTNSKVIELDDSNIIETVETFSGISINNIKTVNDNENKTVNKKNKKSKKSENMNTVDKIKQVEDALVSMEPAVKVVKSDRGLIERTESSKIILTEDNRQLLVD
jgi:hypothetical protein